jgi:hypothetical protein
MGLKMIGDAATSKPFNRRILVTVATLLSVSAVASLLIAAGPARMPARMPAATGHPAAARLQVNRHLHGVTPSTKVEHRERDRKEHRDWHHHHPWHERWNYVEWLSVHHGTGTIIGTVLGKDEEPAANVVAVLRNSRGKVLKRFSRKHLTHTDSAGHFVMRHVLPGSYRLRASVGKTAGSTPITVHSGTVLHEAVHL